MEKMKRMVVKIKIIGILGTVLVSIISMLIANRILEGLPYFK